jgi:DNA polymerase-1
LSIEHLGYKPLCEELVYGKGAKATAPADLPATAALAYVSERADLPLQLAGVLRAKLASEGLDGVYRSLEWPLVSVLVALEQVGVRIDTAALGALSQSIDQEMQSRSSKIFELAGEPFNINSPKQLAEILFEKLNLPVLKKTGTTRVASTSVEVLEELALTHDLPRLILEWRSMQKLKGTYIDALPLLVNKQTGRVHTSFNQAVAATGRLSSSDPNLQNIPVRTALGREIRRAFVAEPGFVLISADYSQIELRVLAHLSGDEALIDAFAAGEDIHSRTASDIFGVFPEMVNPDMRRQAKVINFGVLYGMSAFGLAKELGITQKLAQAYIDGYFQKFAKVREYLDGLLVQARRDGYVTTLLLRRRYLPEIMSPQAAVRQFAERMAINAPIQGTAADLIKVAMVRIFRRLTEEGLSAAIIMQVHDELVFEAPVSEREVLIALVCEEMEGVLKLNVPLRVEVASGRNWDEAHT